MNRLENTLQKFGVTLAESTRLRQLPPTDRSRELTQNLSAFANEVLLDRPVSILYHYWSGQDSKLYTHPSFQPIYLAESQFDPQERAGLPLMGFQKMERLVLDNPNNVVLWYSPAGQASFDNDPKNPYTPITYNYGQLYIQYFDREKVNAVALKVTNEDVLYGFSPSLWQMTHQTSGQQKIGALLQNPVLTGLNIDNLLNKIGYNSPVYQDKNGQIFFLQEVLAELRQTLAGKNQLSTPTDKTIGFLHQLEITSENVLRLYLQTIHEHQIKTGETATVLSGSCGGGVVKHSAIAILLGLDQNPISKIIGLYSSARRLLEQKTNNLNNTLECTCPKCNQRVKATIENNTIHCPNCHATAPYRC